MLSKSLSIQFELLAVDVVFSKTLAFTVVGCYRPSSATNESLSSFMDILSILNVKEIVLIGDFNWNWLQPLSVEIKLFCDAFNIQQLVNTCTRLNLKKPDESSLLDLIFTNVPVTK